MENTNITNITNMPDDNIYTGVTPLPENTVTAMAYVPFQTDTTQYAPETALKEGTLFANLNKPFLGGKCQ